MKTWIGKAVAIAATATGMLLLAGTTPKSVQAAGREFCEAYAHDAVMQVRAAFSNRACEHHLEGTRWSPEWRVHFDWCLTVPPREADGERYARREHLRACGL
jgi:hypothetical protein